MRKISLAVIVALLTACAGGMNVNPGGDKWTGAYVKAHIEKGKTTQDQVKALYGAPDSINTKSYGGTSWVYRKNGTLTAISDLLSDIPGTSSAKSGIDQATSASKTSDKAMKASDKVTGNTSVVRGNRLMIFFDKNNRVEDWFFSD